MARLFPLGGVHGVVLGALSLGVLAYTAYSFVPTAYRARSTVSHPAHRWLGVLGLDAQSLAAAGVTPEQAEGIKERLQEHLATHGENLQAVLDAKKYQARRHAESLRLVRSGRSAPSGENAPRDLLDAAEVALESAISAAINSSLNGLAPEVSERLAAIRSTQAIQVPAPYRLVQRTATAWEALNTALEGERQAAERSHALPEGLQSLLADVRAEPQTAAALQNSAVNLAAIRNALAQ